MLNRGISTGALFMLVGYLYERRHSLEIAAYGGVATPAQPCNCVSDYHAGVDWSADAQQLRGRVFSAPGRFVRQLPGDYFRGCRCVLSACYMLWLYQRRSMERRRNRSATICPT
jgi:NADH-quinone oxidoreductase subunit M